MLNAIKITNEVPLKDIGDLLCSALEGGSNYWYQIESIEEPPAYMVRSDAKQVFKHLDAPLNSGGSVWFTTLEKDKIKGAKRWNLNLRTVAEGLKVFATKYPKHYADFLSEDYDATTGDVFLQCCLFGEVVFG